MDHCLVFSCVQALVFGPIFGLGLVACGLGLVWSSSLYWDVWYWYRLLIFFWWKVLYNLFALSEEVIDYLSNLYMILTYSFDIALFVLGLANLWPWLWSPDYWPP